MVVPNAGTVDDFFPSPDLRAKTPRKRRSKRKDLEAAVQRECLLWLGRRSEVIYVERRNTGAIAFEDGSRISFGTPGAADIWCLIRSYRHETLGGGLPCRHGVTVRHSDGVPIAIAQCHPEDWSSDCEGCVVLRHVEIECKRRDGKGRLSPSQRAFKQFCDDNSIPYLVVTSAEEMEQKLADLELLIC